jgi:hypothetical protein
MAAPLHVYLDQNKWIDLARAYHGHPGGKQYELVLQRALDAVDAGRVIFPLTASHFIETAKDPKPERRARLAEVMVLLSRCVTMAASPWLIRAQLRSGIRALFDSNAMPPQVTVFGIGPFFAFSADYPPRSDRPRHQLTAAMTKHYSCTADGMRSLLSMPIEEFRSHGIEAVQRDAEDFARQEEGSRQANWDCPPDMRRRIYMARTFVTFDTEVTRALAEIGRTKEDFAALGPDRIMEFLAHCPILQAELELFCARNDHRDRDIEVNDCSDIAHVQLGVAYCDALVTEKFWSHLIRRARLDTRFQCQVFSSVNELEPMLRNSFCESIPQLG